jgi:hypothetical protein
MLWIVGDKGRNRAFVRFDGLPAWLKLFRDVLLRVRRLVEVGTRHGGGLQKMGDAGR